MAGQPGAGRAVQLTAEEVLAVLPAEASPKLRAAIASGCCLHYYVAEGQCVAGGCGSGKCCFHIVGSACGVDEYKCLPFPCDKGTFSTGC
jgi:hypothetical protein